mmetsp:Transcript_34626/g.87022  ORF Transcript_34626/g.87022 Transcript_34626/m.87022 type:complete len:313 (+) Transcript_34626:4021-4959(+)
MLSRIGLVNVVRVCDVHKVVFAGRNVGEGSDACVSGGGSLNDCGGRPQEHLQPADGGIGVWRAICPEIKQNGGTHGLGLEHGDVGCGPSRNRIRRLENGGCANGGCVDVEVGHRVHNVESFGAGGCSVREFPRTPQIRKSGYPRHRGGFQPNWERRLCGGVGAKRQHPVEPHVAVGQERVTCLAGRAKVGVRVAHVDVLCDRGDDSRDKNVHCQVSGAACGSLQHPCSDFIALLSCRVCEPEDARLTIAVGGGNVVVVFNVAAVLGQLKRVTPPIHHVCLGRVGVRLCSLGTGKKTNAREIVIDFCGFLGNC